MAFNGSGTFNLPAGNPVSGVSNSTVHNNTNSEIAVALTNCVTRDGQSPATANIPMGGFKLTGLAAGASPGDAVRYEQAAKLTGFTLTGLANLAAGANIASAATIDLTEATGNSPRITGTAATSAVTMSTGQQMIVVADGAWPLTYHATTNKMNTGGANYTCAAGDIVLYYKDLSGVVHGTIFPVSGTAVVSSGVAEVAWADYGATSTIVGWSSFTSKLIYTKKIGKTVLVSFSISGTSNATGVTFTLPYAAAAGVSFQGHTGYGTIDNTSTNMPDGVFVLGAGGSTVTVYTSVAGANWTASGTKTVTGTFSYEAAA